ncbi:pyridoxal phosphate-dependent aminotransferase [candidate division CSSED10-310 bacterium]|uniref:Aminotransferase n=1 Tax=candidate division CSSED10-310 bacterium TaxID=2855610 RepID=A0ABV6YW29_UNCC1
MLAERVKRIELSTTLKISAKAKAMKAAGIDVIDLSVGEPDFPTPENIKDAARLALDENFTHYTQNDGIPELKKAIITKLAEDNQVSYEPDQIIVSCGAKHSLYNLAVALLNKGEEVIVPAPYWVSYPQQILLAKGKPVIVPTREEDGFRLTTKQLNEHLNFNTKALIINNPSNPTGTGYPRAELEALAQQAVAEGLFIIADEIYEKIVYDDFKFVSIASLGKAIQERTIIINGVSKAYSMTGWRIGFAAGPKEIIAGMNKLQSHNTSNPNSIAQKASIEAFIGPQHSISQMNAEFQKRRNFMMQKLKLIQGISCYQPQGAFYLFPNIAATFGKEYQGMTIRNSFGLAYYLLKEAHVAVVPGEAFGADNYIRLSYATSMTQLEQSMDRIIDAMSKLHVSRKTRKIRLNNVNTKVKGRLGVETELNADDRDALVNEAEYYLPFDHYYEWNANINGVIVQLRTNVSHLYDFWVENWYPAQIESDLEPHGIVYVVDGIPGREPVCYYHSDSKTGIIFNTSYYGQAKQVAVGIVSDLGERLFNVHTVRASCLDYQGQGMLILHAPNVKKERHFYELLAKEGVRLHSDDVVFIRYREKSAIADISERKYYLRTRIMKEFPDFRSLFERSKCENVVSTSSECVKQGCHLEECALDQGEPFCFFAFDKSRSMIDPIWVNGPDGYVKRTDIKWIVILYFDPYGSALKHIEAEHALTILEEGHNRLFQPTVSLEAEHKEQSFYNPYLHHLNPARKEIQKMYYRQLLSLAKCFGINTALGEFEEIQSRIKSILDGA